jgi:hypothetical protein
MAETTHSNLPEPDNAELVERVRADIARRRRPAEVEPEDGSSVPDPDLASWDADA